MMRRNPAVKRNDRKSNLLDHSWRNDRLIFRQDHQGTRLRHVSDIFLGMMGAAFGGWTAKSFATSILTAVVGAMVMVWLSTRPAKRMSQQDRTNRRLSQ